MWFRSASVRSYDSVEETNHLKAISNSCEWNRKLESIWPPIFSTKFTLKLPLIKRVERLYCILFYFILFQSQMEKNHLIIFVFNPNNVRIPLRKLINYQNFNWNDFPHSFTSAINWVENYRNNKQSINDRKTPFRYRIKLWIVILVWNDRNCNRDRTTEWAEKQLEKILYNWMYA